MSPHSIRLRPPLNGFSTGVVVFWCAVYVYTSKLIR